MRDVTSSVVPPPRQEDLFGDRADDRPAGFRYAAELISPAEEAVILQEMGRLDFRPYMFRGYPAARKVVSFGGYADHGDGFQPLEALPEQLQSVRALAAGFADLREEDLQQVLVTEYPPGAGIGWHRDRPQFRDVVGVSLATPCDLRFRCKTGETWRRLKHLVEPRSAYLLRGPARDVWEHSIAPLSARRYSITFRTSRP